ncbi:hypothetical protein Ocin01_16694 [Orchesella cincta]|uniref:Uncharacterized protein n=1 Tax=Orchesella cincta TaxID=48709 RepID=A0A1D2MAN0_ORCCI|nr:hypothetical protein Ocin01_16694 [Orchesella cincta]
MGVPKLGSAIKCHTSELLSFKDMAQEVRSHPTGCTTKPHFPSLSRYSPFTRAIFRENKSTDACDSLHDQWNLSEKSKIAAPQNGMYNNIKNFICSVCGVKTYRKRIRALPFKKFPVLAKSMQPGSFTICKNRFAIVCLDCSETLWCQSEEYDRWGLPVHKRLYNWMTRTPPPDNSWEACVARLPSGKMQLPRSPPIVSSVIQNKGLGTAKELHSPASNTCLKVKQKTPTSETMCSLPTPDSDDIDKMSFTWSNIIFNY